jgi:hypothetical protein
MTSLAILPLLFLPACTAQPQSHPLNTAPVPTDARFLEQCTSMGVMACSLMSSLSGEAGVERRPACMAYRDSNWKLVETCGSLPVSHP